MEFVHQYKNHECMKHLKNRVLPEIWLPTTNGKKLQLSRIHPRIVLFIFPMINGAEHELPVNWLTIPGATGCTAQSCGFGSLYTEFRAMNTELFGLSSQSAKQQWETKERLHLPFELMSDQNFKLKEALNLPAFWDDGSEYYKRLTIFIRDGRIRKTFYPVTNPEENASDVLMWLYQNL
jgi:peroxiredoxin